MDEWCFSNLSRPVGEITRLDDFVLSGAGVERVNKICAVIRAKDSFSLS